MTKLNIDRLGDSFAVDYTADDVELRDAQEIIELIVDLYDRQGSFEDGEDFTVCRIEFHGHFKARE